jgi:hypothetical protein
MIRNKLKDKLSQLKELIVKEDPNCNWMPGINHMIEYIYDESMNSDESIELVRDVYKTITTGVNSFADYCIHRDSFDERVRINKKLSEITDEIWRLLDL